MAQTDGLRSMIRFLIIGTCLYVGWYMLYEFYLKKHSLFDEWLIHQIVVPAESGLRGLGYILSDYSTLDPLFRSHIGISGSLGVTIGAPCDGAPLLALFMAFIIAFPGPWRHKWWFLIVGGLAVHLFNIGRVMSLAVIVHWNPDWLAFNHDYTFTILIYGFVFLLWWLWIQYFATIKSVKS
jgi:exosortase family protein XrtF